MNLAASEPIKETEPIETSRSMGPALEDYVELEPEICRSWQIPTRIDAVERLLGPVG